MAGRDASSSTAVAESASASWPDRAALSPQALHGLSRQLLRRARKAARQTTISSSTVRQAVAERLLADLADRQVRSAEELCAYGHAYERAVRGVLGVQAPSGLVYTPLSVARSLVSRLETDGSEVPRVLDPACGCGALLLAALERWPSARVCGLDTDDQALRLAAALLGRLSKLIGGSPALSLRRADLFGEQPPTSDVWLMNPPFGTSLSAAAVRQAARSSLTGREPDTFALAVERALGAAPHPALGLIVPDVVRMQPEYRELRRRVTASGRLQSVRALDFGTFVGVTVRPCVLVLGRHASARRRVTISLSEGVGRSTAAPEILRDPSCRWRGEDPRLGDVWSRARRAARRLGEVAACHEGVHTGNIRHKLFVDDASVPDARPLFKGADVRPFAVTFAERYVRYDPSLIDRATGEYASLRDPAIFEGPKLLSRQTSDRLTVCLDPSDTVTDNSLHTIRLREDADVTLEWLAILLNSALMTALYRYQSGEWDRPLPQIKLKLLRELPVRAPAAGHDAARRLHRRACREARAGTLSASLWAASQRIVFDSYAVGGSDRKWILALHGCRHKADRVFVPDGGPR